MKSCNYCNEELNYSYFSTNKITADGYSNRCKSCTSKVRSAKRVPVPRIKYDLNRTEKECKTCNNVLKIENFGKSKVLADGRENDCKVCRKKRRKENSARRLEDGIINSEKCCTSCKESLEIINFSMDSSRDDGFSTICKDCKSKAYAEYRKQSGNDGKAKVRSATWKLKNPKYNSKYYIKNKKHISSRVSKYQKTTAGKWALFCGQAKYRKLENKLNFKLYKMIVIRECTYCGRLKSGGIDRIDSNIGYLEDNVKSCCSACNYMKNDLSLDDFKNHIRKIITFNKTGQTEDRFPFISPTGDPKKDYYYTIHGKWSWYKSQAKKRKKKFDINYAEFSQFWQKPCAYCGSTIDTIGLDRIDNNIGYEFSNINPCCFRCNSMKKESSLAEFIKHSNIIFEKFINNTEEDL